MTTTENVIKGWGGLALVTRGISKLTLEIDNAVDAVGHADFSGQRATYLETLHDMTHAAVAIVEVYPTATTKALFDAQVVLKAGAPIRVLKMLALTDKVNGGTNDYYWSDQAEDITGLYENPLFTGLLDDWSYSTNTLFLELSGTERQDHKEIPEKRVTFSNWPISPRSRDGKAYPEVWGNPGDVLDSNKIGDGLGAVPAILVTQATAKHLLAGHDLEGMGGARAGTGNAGLIFDGANGHITIGGAADLNFDGSTPFSFEMRVYVPAAPGSHGSLISKMKFATDNGWNFYYASTAGVLQMDISGPVFGTDTIRVNGSTDLRAGAVVTVGMTYDGSKTAAGVKLYVNGVLETPSVTVDNFSTTVATTGLPYIGSQRLLGGYYLEGTIYWCRVWSTERTVAQLLGNINNERLPVQSGLEAQWILGAGNGLTIPDLSGNDLPGTITGGVTGDAGLTFDGVDGQMVVGEATDFDFDASAPFTIEFRISVPASLAQGAIIAKMANGSPYLGWDVIVGADGLLTLQIIETSVGGDWLDVSGSSDLRNTGFKTGSITYDGSKAGAGVALYVDGVLETPSINQDTLTGDSSNTLVPTIGGRSGGGIPLDATLGWVRVWNTERTAAEVLANYNRARLEPQTGLVGQWVLQHMGHGTTLADLSGNGKTGTLSGGVTVYGGITVPVWAKIPGYSEALGYVEGATIHQSDTDPEGHTIATVQLPGNLARVFVPCLVQGSRGTNTADSPDNLAGRDPDVVASFATGEVATMAMGPTLSDGATIRRVWIAWGPLAVTNMQARILGPIATIVGTAAGYIAVDSVAGWDATGKVMVSGGTVYEYSSITEISDTEWRLVIAAYSASDTGSVTSVVVTGTPAGAWVTATGGEIEVSNLRDWKDGAFWKFELGLQKTGGSEETVGWLGFRVEVELPSDPEIFMAARGAPVSFRSVDYGGGAAPAVIMADLHKRHLGFPESRLGDTFDAGQALLDAWKFGFSLHREMNSGEVFKELLRQSRSFSWRDGSNNVQVGVYRLDDVATLTLTETADIVDPAGEGLRVSYVPPEEVYNRIYLRWGYNYATGAPGQTYHITEDSSRPVDTVRQADAVNSQSQFKITGTLEVDAPWIQDAGTALDFLQFLFDFHRVRRRRIRFRVPAFSTVAPGLVVKLSHGMVNPLDTFLVEAVTQRGEIKEVDGITITLEGVLDDLVGYKGKATMESGVGWGAPEVWETWGGGTPATTGAVTGRVSDYGLALLAQRHFQDGTEIPAVLAFGSGSTPLAASQVALVSEISTRQTPDMALAGQVWTFIITVPNDTGSPWTVREIGLFTGATGSNLVARILLASDVTVADAESLRITFTLETVVPAAGSAVTTYGLDLFAQRIRTNTTEKPTHYAIGTDATAEDPTDVVLVAQVGARVAWSAGWPKRNLTASEWVAFFLAATYGGNTIAEVGIFTAAAGSNAVVRKVLADTIVLGPNDDFTAHHKLTAGSEA